MTSDPNKISDLLWSRLKDELIKYHKEIRIEYLDYKQRKIYDYETEKKDFESEFYHFPCEEISVNQNIQIFHTFYEIDVWGLLGEVKLGDEKLALSLEQISRNTKIIRPKFIFNKLSEKYSYIKDNVQRALIGPKSFFQLSAEHPEPPILVNLQNLYNKILSNPDSQLKLFENINLNKTVSDIYTEILANFIHERLNILSPKLKQYKKKVKDNLKIEDVEISKDIPLIKQNFNPEQQTQVIQLLFEILIPEFIDTTYLQFERHFISKRSKLKKLVWKGKEVEIAHLFQSLKNKKIIITQQQNVLIEHHFLNNKGEPFNFRQLSVSLSKTQIENFPEILNIVDKLEKLVLTFI